MGNLFGLYRAVSGPSIGFFCCFRMILSAEADWVYGALARMFWMYTRWYNGDRWRLQVAPTPSRGNFAVNVGAARFAICIASSEDEHGNSVSCMSKMHNRIIVAHNGHDFISNEVV